MSESTSSEAILSVVFCSEDEVLKESLLACSEGLEIETAGLSATAYDVIVAAAPDCVIVHLGESPHRGFLLLDILSHRPKTSEINLIAIGDKTTRFEALRRGAGDYLAAPFEPSQILRTAVTGGLKARSQGGSILVVDDDDACRSLCRAVLMQAGYQVRLAADADEAARLMEERIPELVVMDIMMPERDGVMALQAMRRDSRLRTVPVIFLTALSTMKHKSRAFRAGGDDYLVKPFDGRELCLRVEATIRKQRERESVSPNTLLPGSYSVGREIAARRKEGKPFAFCYVDIDNFKAFNDHYGHLRADSVIKQLADLLRMALDRAGTGRELLAHIAGDDFVLIGDPETCREVLRLVIREFDALIPYHYDAEDREKGLIEAVDRHGIKRSFPIMSLSIAVVPCGGETSYVDASDRAATLKNLAKRHPGSVLLSEGEEPPGLSGAERELA